MLASVSNEIPEPATCAAISSVEMPHLDAAPLMVSKASTIWFCISGVALERSSIVTPMASRNLANSSADSPDLLSELMRSPFAFTSPSRESIVSSTSSPNSSR